MPGSLPNGMGPEVMGLCVQAFVCKASVCKSVCARVCVCACVKASLSKGAGSICKSFSVQNPLCV